MRMIFGIFPLLAIPIVIYNLMALTAGGGIDANGVSSIAMQLSDPVRGTPVFGAVEAAAARARFCAALTTGPVRLMPSAMPATRS